MKPAKYVVLLATVPGLAVAQDCGDIADDTERLACYDALHKPAPVPAAAPAPEATPVPEAAPAPAATPEPEVPPEPAAAPPRTTAPAAVPVEALPENFGLKEKEAKGPKHTLMARIEKIQKVGNVDYLFLDNGQVWREIGGDNGFRFRAGRGVTISEGALGSYDLKMEGLNRRTKVKRVR